MINGITCVNPHFSYRGLESGPTNATAAERESQDSRIAILIKVVEKTKTFGEAAIAAINQNVILQTAVVTSALVSIYVIYQLMQANVKINRIKDAFDQQNELIDIQKQLIDAQEERLKTLRESKTALETEMQMRQEIISGLSTQLFSALNGIMSLETQVEERETHIMHQTNLIHQQDSVIQNIAKNLKEI